MKVIKKSPTCAHGKDDQGGRVFTMRKGPLVERVGADLTLGTSGTACAPISSEAQSRGPNAERCKP